MRAVLLSASDTDGLAAAQSDRPWVWRNPSGVAAEEVTSLLTDADVVVLRLLGSARTRDELISLVTALGKLLAVVSGEQLIDTELLACSTVSAEIAHATHLYLAASGADNMVALRDYLELAICTPGMSPCDASEHVPAPHAHPAWGIMGTDPGRSELSEAHGRVVIVFYRSHYLAAYWWLAADQALGGWGAHAIVHVGKHGNWEWLPGKQNTLSPLCCPDAALRDLPVIYPFLINDSGEGPQAKRRAHAVLVSELGRPRIDVTLRISGFFRDAFPAAIALMDDAVQLVANLPEDAADNYVRAHALLDEPEGSSGKNWRHATTRIFGSRPGTYGAGVIQLMESGQWETTTDIAEVYTTWGGYAYGRNMAGVEARAAMRHNFARITVATKNVDSREHDIFDSDDYFQFHGGMVATVEALRSHKPDSYIGDSTRPSAVRHRSLSREATRVVRARVLHPRWLAGMRKHGYKGAFEIAATVDYLFGYDATIGVLEDWMYSAVADSYVLDTENRTFLEEANPWALHGICERLMEAVQRGLWENPDPQMVNQLTDLLLDTEGSME